MSWERIPLARKRDLKAQQKLKDFVLPRVWEFLLSGRVSICSEGKKFKEMSEIQKGKEEGFTKMTRVWLDDQVHD